MKAIELNKKGTFDIKDFNHLRSKCLVYTRVMGYHRPVESFNLGKQGEYKNRLLFCENKHEEYI